MLDPTRLHVTFLPGTGRDGPLTPRRYTLTHSDRTGHLFLSVGTVKRHVYNIFTKLEATGRIEAIARARELKLL